MLCSGIYSRNADTVQYKESVNIYCSFHHTYRSKAAKVITSQFKQNQLLLMLKTQPQPRTRLMWRQKLHSTQGPLLSLQAHPAPTPPLPGVKSLLLFSPLFTFGKYPLPLILTPKGGFCGKLKMATNSLSNLHQEVKILFLILWIWPHLVMCSAQQNVAADTVRVLSLGSTGFAVFALVLPARLACWKDHMEENPGQWSAKYQICRWGSLGPPSPSWPTM